MFKKIGKSFLNSYLEITGRNKIRTIAITAMFIAISMVIEKFTIVLPFAKINFAYIAIAAIGMLFGPTISFFAGGICDIVGFIACPDGAFMPAYTIVACFQGLIYGLILYNKNSNFANNSDVNTLKKNSEFIIRIIIARLLDILIINLCINTILNMHYGFIPAQSLSVAIPARITKNLIQFGVDVPILIILLSVIMITYKQTINKQIQREA